jgi:hypothetical protein
VNEESQAALRAALAVDEPAHALEVPDHPVTSKSELSIDDDVALCVDPTYKSYQLLRVCSIEPFLVGQRFKEIPITQEQQRLGVDRTRSNVRTASTWELMDEDDESSFEQIRVETILQFGNLFTARMKLKETVSRDLAKFLARKGSAATGQSAPDEEVGGEKV